MKERCRRLGIRGKEIMFKLEQRLRMQLTPITLLQPKILICLIKYQLFGRKSKTGKLNILKLTVFFNCNFFHRRSRKAT